MNDEQRAELVEAILAFGDRMAEAAITDEHERRTLGASTTAHYSWSWKRHIEESIMPIIDRLLTQPAPAEERQISVTYACGCQEYWDVEPEGDLRLVGTCNEHRSAPAEDAMERVLRFWQLPSDEPTRLYMPWDSEPDVIRGNGGDQPCWALEEVEPLLLEELEFCNDDGGDPSDVYALEVTVKKVLPSRVAAAVAQAKKA